MTTYVELASVFVGVEPRPAHPPAQAGQTPSRAALLDAVERRLDRGDAVGAMRRLGAWALEPASLGERGAELLARAARSLGRPELAPSSEGGLARSEPSRDALVVEANGAWFRVGVGPPARLTRSPSLRRLLASLAAHPGGLAPRELFAAVWPERRVACSVVHNRVDVGLARLRKLGLSERIVRREGRVALSGRVEVVS